MPHRHRHERSQDRPRRKKGARRAASAEIAVSNAEQLEQVGPDTADATPTLDAVVDVDETPADDGLFDAVEGERQTDAEDPDRERAEAYTAHIGRSEAIFEAERAENDPYTESVIDRKRRHRRNKAHKKELLDEADAYAGIFKADKQLHRAVRHNARKDAKADYKEEQERNPETLRRLHNKELKQKIRDEEAQRH